MNFPTNSVSQFHYIEGRTVEKQETTAGVSFKIFDDKGNLVEKTDVINKDNILYAKQTTASEDVVYRKGLNIKIADDMLVKGQEYVITLRISDFSDEDVVVKAGMAFGTTASNATKFYSELAYSFLASAHVDYAPLFELYDAVAGTKADIVDAKKLVMGRDSDGKRTVYLADGSTAPSFTKGFWIVEAKPDWRIATVPERLAKFTVGTSEVLVDFEFVNDWLVNRDFAPIKADDLKITNTHKVADLEYFCKFEKGNKDGYANWPDGILPDLYVEKDNADGYAILTVHYAYVGPGTEVQKAERDAIFVAKSETSFSSIKTDLGIS